MIAQTRGVQGLRELAEHAGAGAGRRRRRRSPSAIDFVLEGLYAQKKISRSDERGYSAAEAAAPRRGARREEPAHRRRDPDAGGEEEVLQLEAGD